MDPTTWTYKTLPHVAHYHTLSLHSTTPSQKNNNIIIKKIDSVTSFTFILLLILLSLSAAANRNLRRSKSGRVRVFISENMEGVIGLVNKIQRACTLLGDYGDDRTLPTLWDALPTIVVLGGQVRFVKTYFWCFCFCV